MPKGKRNQNIVPLDEDQPDREALLIQNLFTSPSTTEAALQAGYSPSYASTSVRLRLKDPKFIEKIRDYAKAHDLIDSIPKILRIEDKCLTALETLNGKELLDSYSKFAPIAKQKKQIAGLLQHDVAPQQPTISIESVQNLMLNVSSNPASTPGNVQQTHKPLITHDKAE